MNHKGKATLKICSQKLNYLNYSQNTIKIYLHYINEFLQNIDKPTIHCNSTDFQNYLENYNYTSISQQNQVINAVRFLYKHVLNKKYNKVNFNRPKKQKTLPRIIDQDILKQKILNIQNLKHKAILALTFSVGLRVSEVINLKITDVDSKRMLIHINKAKGRKDRIVPLSSELLLILREYYKSYRPNLFLFNGQNSLQYSATSCNNIFKKYLDRSGHFHLLRHASLTAMLENGTDLRIIQKIAGHTNIKTTEIYTHVSNNMLTNVATAI